VGGDKQGEMMFGWEYSTIDLSAVAFGELPRLMAKLECQGWQPVPLQSADAPSRLRLAIRRPMPRGTKIWGLVRIAG